MWTVNTNLVHTYIHTYLLFNLNSLVNVTKSAILLPPNKYTVIRNVRNSPINENSFSYLYNLKRMCNKDVYKQL